LYQAVILQRQKRRLYERIYERILCISIYEGHSIIKDTNSCGGKTVGERVIILSEQKVV